MWLRKVGKDCFLYMTNHFMSGLYLKHKSIQWLCSDSYKTPSLWFISTMTLVTRKIWESQTEFRKIIGLGDFLSTGKKLIIILDGYITFLFWVHGEQRWHTYLLTLVVTQSKTIKPRYCRLVPSPVLNSLQRKADAFFQDSGFIKGQPIMTEKELPGGLCSFLRIYWILIGHSLCSRGSLYSQ